MYTFCVFSHLQVLAIFLVVVDLAHNTKTHNHQVPNSSFLWCHSTEWGCWFFWGGFHRFVSLRLLFSEVREPPIVPGPLSYAFSGRVGHVQFWLGQAAPSPHQSGSPQHHRPEAPSFFQRSISKARFSTFVLVSFLRRADTFNLQRLLLTRRLSFPKPER